ncbi:aldehyde dehydrogenase family protein [Actinocorallia aurantiaca]|uniref:NAD-dependent succinate-semialdehyde dehydrogenase n=1 Tax=Actinocorallia aurantiaca TaxID=46204 RepID=A0ABN3UQB1_9ACTN
MTTLAPVRDPRTGEVIEELPLMAERDAPGLAQRAAGAFGAWSRVPPRRRAEILAGTARVLAGRAPAIAPRFALESGKTLLEARAELARACETLLWIAGHAEDVLRPVVLEDLEDSGLIREVTAEPAGPVLAIVPSNFPAVVTARKAGAALAMGCPVVLKAPETTPSVVRAFTAAATEAGLPEGVLRLAFTTPGGAAALVRRPEFRTVSFTGSTRTGRLVAAAAAETLAQCVLELGGHAPAIVTADADLDAAVSALVPMKFGSAGQSCAAPSRFLVAESAASAFLARLLAALPALECDPSGTHATLGPLHTESRRAEVHALVQDAVTRGAVLRSGGRVPDHPGYYYPPTVLTDVPATARILAEEPFGPLIPLQTFTTESEAVALAGSTPYALGAFLFGPEPRMRALAPRLNAGRVSINSASGADPASPLSGRSESGYGYEGGREGLQAFTRLKVTITPAKAGVCPT